MSDNIKSNQIISDKLNVDESNLNNKKEDLMLRLKEVHCKSEERTFDLNEKFNQIKGNLTNKLSNSIYLSILEANVGEIVGEQVELAAAEKLKGSLLFF